MKMLKFTIFFVITYFVMYWLTDLYIKSWDDVKKLRFAEGKPGKWFKAWLWVLTFMAGCCVVFGVLSTAEWFIGSVG